MRKIVLLDGDPHLTASQRMAADQGAKANPRSAPPAIADGLGRRFSFHAFGLWPHGGYRSAPSSLCGDNQTLHLPLR